MFPRDDDKSIISQQESAYVNKINESKVQLQQLIKSIKAGDEIEVKSWLAKNIQSNKQV